MNQASIILNAFNDQFSGLLEDMHTVFPDNIDIMTAQNSMSMIRKANPKLTIKIWKSYVVDKYGDKFDSNDISFFIEKNYMEDLSNLDQPNKIMESIDNIRDPIKLMDKSNKDKTMKYLQNLKKLCVLYHELI